MRSGIGSCVAWLKAAFCRHEFQMLMRYDLDTVKAYCSKCGRTYVVNTTYKWKFHLDKVSERDYENLRGEIERFRESYGRGEV